MSPVMRLGVIAACLAGCRNAAETGGAEETVPAACAKPGCRPALRGRFLGADRPSLDGRVTLVNYWASWCRPCLLEMPAIEAIWRRHRNRGFVVLGVLVADDEGDPEIRRVAALRGVTYPILRGGGNMDEIVGIGARWPTSFLYDRTGHVAHAWEGRPLTGPQLDAEVKALLEAP